MAVFSRTWFLIAVVPLLIAVFYSRETKIADSPSERSQRSPIRKSYSCGPCVLPDCHCPSTAIPGGLALNDTPQFILLTFDDAVSTTTFPLELAILKANSNPINNPAGSCQMPATFYVSTDYTDYWLTQQLYAQGNEIAAHTIDHPAQPNIAQINGSISAISTFGMIPRSDITGFRAPFLNFSMETFQNVKDIGLKYECTNPITPLTAPWPFTYDYGFPYGCETGYCDPPQAFPGLWSVPMTTLLSPSDDTDEYASMDPIGDADFIMSLLQYNFKIHWARRLPFSLWLHAAWLMIDTTRTATLNAFYAWAKAYTNGAVYFVTASQLIQWTQNPVPLSQMPNWGPLQCDWAFNSSKTKSETCNGLDDDLNGVIDDGLTSFCNLGTYYSNTCAYCPAAEPSEPLPVPPPLAGYVAPDTTSCPGGTTIPPTGCIQGQWQNCTCVCIGAGNDAMNGFCQDATGACTVVKTYANSKFTCPGANDATTAATTTVLQGQFPDGQSSTTTTAQGSASTPSSAATASPSIAGSSSQGQVITSATVTNNGQTNIAIVNQDPTTVGADAANGASSSHWSNLAVLCLCLLVLTLIM